MKIHSWKKVIKYRYIIFLIIASILPIIPFFVSQDLLHTHDGLVHVPRLAAYYHALSDGHFPVRFAGYLNYGYGLPLFNFIYQTPYLIGSVFLFIGFSLINAFKLSLVLSFLISGIAMYFFAKEYFGDERKALLVAVFYQFAPFRIVELLVRGSYGEVYTYAFFPFILYGIARVANKRLVSGFAVISLSTFLLIISHNSVSLLFFFASLLFAVLVSNNLKKIIVSCGALILGVGCAAFYWIPAILEHKYTYGNLYMQNLYKEHFVPVVNFFIPNFTNDPSLQTGGIATFIGFFHFLAIVLCVFLYKKNKDKRFRQIIFYSAILLVVSFFFMLPVSTFIWESSHASLLRQFQFPWRFLALVVVATSLLSVSYSYKFKFLSKNIFYFSFLVMVIFSVAFYFRPSLGYKKVNESYYWNFPLNTTYYGETDVIWSAGPAKSYPKAQIEIISGSGKIKNILKKNQIITFKSISNESLSLVSSTQYYPGWKVFIDKKEVPIQFQDPNHRGLIVFSIPKGEHDAVIRFDETKLRFVANMISIISLAIIIPLAKLINKRLA